MKLILSRFRRCLILGQLLFLLCSPAVSRIGHPSAKEHKTVILSQWHGWWKPSIPPEKPIRLYFCPSVVKNILHWGQMLSGTIRVSVSEVSVLLLYSSTRLVHIYFPGISPFQHHDRVCPCEVLEIQCGWKTQYVVHSMFMLWAPSCISL